MSPDKEDERRMPLSLPPGMLEKHGEIIGYAGIGLYLSVRYLLEQSPAKPTVGDFLSQDEIAQVLGVSDRTVRNHLPTLVRLGYLAIRGEPGLLCHYRVPAKSKPRKDLPVRTEPQPVVMSLPTSCGEGWNLRIGKLREWESTYPFMDVRVELRKASQWLRDNPEKAKTQRGMTRFLGSWLMRSQDKGTFSRKPAANTFADAVDNWK